MLDQIDVDLNIAIERANYFFTKTRITEEKDLLSLWEKHNIIVDELKIINADFFKKLYSLQFPVGETNTNYERQSYTVFSGKHVTPVIDGLNRIKGFVQSYRKILPKDILNNPLSVGSLEILTLLSDRLYNVARQLRKRHDNRPTIDLQDEYDLQDLFHSLLKLFFTDIRAEDVSPHYAGGGSRIDFILKTENIGIELKFGRKTLRAKELGSQLTIDIARYQSYPNLKMLFCFVFDPEGWIDNPKGIENDLNKNHNGIQVIVRIKPET